MTIVRTAAVNSAAQLYPLALPQNESPLLNRVHANAAVSRSKNPTPSSAKTPRNPLPLPIQYP